MEFAWDNEKYKSNIAKHGVAFDIAYEAEWVNAFYMADTRFDYGEKRIIAFVPIKKRVYMVVFVKRNNARRIISLRKANKREVKYYEQNYR